MSKKISDYVEVKNQRVSSRYKRSKVAVGHFVNDYMDGKIDITIPLIDLLSLRGEVFTYEYTAKHISFFFRRLIPEVVIHSKKQDERIVRNHYNNKNDLFNWFLGEKMIYTSCYFKDDNESLEQAQENKLNLVAQKMQLKPGEELLDIGCGWGTFAAHAAKHYGVDVTGVTIAQAGADWGNQQIKDYGVEDKARILTMDYRDIPMDKKYAKISCLEMAEHVGIKYFRKFMKQIYDLLEDDGLFYLQIAGLRYRPHLLSWQNREDLVWGLFMSENIFSGADASMPLHWDLTRLEQVGFETHSVENIGYHYSLTIYKWLQNWLSNKDRVIEKYGEREFRMYEIFLAWSVLIARYGSSSAYQVVCHKNLDHFQRSQFIGGVNMGEHNEFLTTDELVG